MKTFKFNHRLDNDNIYILAIDENNAYKILFKWYSRASDYIIND